MNNLSIIEKLTERPLSKYVVFNRLPILSIEAFFSAIIDNPYVSKDDLEKFREVTVMRETYEGWHNISGISIKDDKVIRQIISEAERKIILYKDFLTQAQSRQEIPREELVNTIRKIHEIAIDVYRENSILNEDIIDTEDEQLLRMLPEIRLRVSEESVSPIWDIYGIILQSIEKETKVSLGVLENLTTDELFQLLEGKQEVASRGVPNRPIAFVIMENKLTVIADDQAVAVEEKLREIDPEGDEIVRARAAGEIQGKSAHKGIVKGTVVILNEKDYPHANEVLAGKKEYILVTPMTRPEIEMYFTDALAFVTDEGGITCHAAIVARELKKPCVIATKIGTKVFKDGDMVEVDADKGIVKILT